MVSKFMEISKLKSACEANKKQCDEVQKIINELEMKSIRAEDDISQMNASMEPALMNITMMNRRNKENTTSVKELWAAIEALRQGSGATIPMPVQAAPVEIKMPEGGNFDVN